MTEEKRVMYKIISANDLEELTKLVNRAISDGYVPYGDFIVDEGYLQPMVDKSLKDIKVGGAVGVSGTITANVNE